MDPVGATLTVTVDHDPDGTPVLVLDGQLDLATAMSAEKALETIPAPLSDGSGSVLVIDMTKLTFMDSSGITVLLMAVNRGYAVRVRRPSAIVRHLLAATGLNETLPVER